MASAMASTRDRACDGNHHCFRNWGCDWQTVSIRPHLTHSHLETKDPDYSGSFSVSAAASFAACATLGVPSGFFIF